MSSSRVSLVAALAAAAGAAAGAAATVWWQRRSGEREREARMAEIYKLRDFSDERVTVAVDVDEVLAHFLPALIDYHNTTYGSELELTDFHSYQFCNVWGGTNEASIEKVHHFFDTTWFHEMPVVRGARETLEAHMSSFNYVVVTSRQHAIEEPTRRWLQRNFPGLFSRILFGNHYGLEGKKYTKPELCRSVGARLLIDDNIKYARQCAEDPEFRVVMFDWENSYRYSAYEGELPPNVRHVHSWEAVSRELGAFASELGV